MTASMHHGVVDSVGTGTVNVNLFGAVVTAYTLDGVTFTEGSVATLIQDGRRLVAIGEIASPIEVPPGDVALLIAWSMPDYDYHSFVDGVMEGTVSVGAYNGPITPVEDVNGLRYTVNRASQHDIDTGWTLYARARGSGTLVLRNYPAAYYDEWDVRATFGTLTSEWAVLSVSVIAHGTEPIVPLLTSDGAFEVDQMSGVYEA